MPRTNDPTLAHLDGVNWTPPQRKASLERIYKNVMTFADDQAAVLARRERRLRVGFSSLRCAAILFFALASVAPVIAESYGIGGPWWARPALATVLLLVAGTALVFEWHFGMRIGMERAARQKQLIRRRARAFEFDWLRWLLDCPEGELPAESARGFVDACEQFCSEIEAAGNAERPWPREAGIPARPIERDPAAGPPRVSRRGPFDSTPRISVEGDETGEAGDDGRRENSRLPPRRRSQISDD
ncbi:MAG: SLATT domain-containing protein [Phycisphaerae bacterium]